MRNSQNRMMAQLRLENYLFTKQREKTFPERATNCKGPVVGCESDPSVRPRHMEEKPDSPG